MTPAGRISPSAIVWATGVGLALGISVLGMATFGVFIVPLANDFGWGRGEISLSYTIMCYTAAFFSPFAGHLIDRYGVRRTLLPSIGLFGLSLIALSFLNSNISAYYASYFALALAGVGTAPPSYSRVVVLWFRERRGLALGAALAGVGIGTAVMPVLLQGVVNRFGWRAAFLCDAALVLLVSWPLAWLFVHEPALRDAGAATQAPLMGLTLREAFKHRSFWQMLPAFSLLGAFTAGIVAHLVPLLLDRGVSPDEAASALSLLGVTLIIGRLCTGYLLDKVFAPIVVCACIGAAALGLLMLRANIEGAGALLAVALIGFVIGAELDFMSYLIAAYFGLRAYGRIYGTFYGVFILGSGLGPLIMGYSHQQRGGYAPAIAILLTGVLIALPLFMTLGPYPVLRHSK